VKINPHSHRSDPTTLVVIRSFSVEEEIELQKNESFCVGAHPWNIEKFPIDWCEQLKIKLQHPKCLALGEVGLDLAIKTPLKTQQHMMQMALEQIEQTSIKRVVLHVVRAHNEVYAIVKKYPHLKFFLHDYQGNLQETQQWMKLNVMFSFSPRLILKNEKLQAVFQSIDQYHKTLETDDFATSINDFANQVKQQFHIGDAQIKQMGENALSFYFD
jgi:TatD DNase family protein